MYKVGITVQIAFAILFSIAFVLSFTEAEKIKEDSRVQVTKKVIVMVESKIDLAEEVVNSKKAQSLLADHQIEVIRAEISSFRESPENYVTQMTQDESEVKDSSYSSGNPLSKALLEKVFGWKKGIKKHIEKAYSNLLTDIRIFCLTNIVGLLLAAIVLYKREVLGKHAVAVSSILTGVIALSALSYLDQNWLFAILLNRYVGYGYPVGIFGTFLWVFLEYHKSKKEANIGN